MPIPVSELQKINPSSIIELFTIELASGLHYDSWVANKIYTINDVVGRTGSDQSINFICTVAGQSGSNEPSAFGSVSVGQTITDNQVTWTAQNAISRFHAGTNKLDNTDIIWQGNTYQKFPCQAEGFEFDGASKSIPRPTFTISNILGTITALFATVNAVTANNDLNGAKFTRIRTLAR